jgi:hypothetical protein
MDTELVMLGRTVTAADLQLVRELLAAHPQWSRYRLSRELCERWQWRTLRGGLRDMACRLLLLRLEQRDLIRLPPRVCASPHRGGRRTIAPVEHDTSPRQCSLATLGPVLVRPVWADPPGLAVFRWLLHRYHYLGFQQAAGENLPYLATDRTGRPLACVLFGAAAWKALARDQLIGWPAALRAQRLSLITNNTRFLIPPWVRVPHLASHVLGQVCRRVAADWRERYGHGVVLLETFVDRTRFRGTCYRAANWQHAGSTAGRGRGDRHHRLQVPVKDIYVYALHPRSRELLCQ